MAEQDNATTDPAQRRLLVSSNMWNIVDHYQVINDNQSGSAGDHRLKVQGGRVSCDGIRGADNVKFKMYSAAMPKGSDVEYVFMLECAGGDSANHMVCLADNKVYTRRRQVDYQTWEQAEKDVLFKKLPRSAHSIYDLFESYHFKGQYLGFDTSGKVITPNLVKTGEPEAWFYVFSPSV